MSDIVALVDIMINSLDQLKCPIPYPISQELGCGCVPLIGRVRGKHSNVEMMCLLCRVVRLLYTLTQGLTKVDIGQWQFSYHDDILSLAECNKVTVSS